MIVRLYLRASTDKQHADRAERMCKQFALDQGSPVLTTYTENASGASLERRGLMRLIGEANRGDVLLVESIDRLTRLKRKRLLSAVLTRPRIARRRYRVAGAEWFRRWPVARRTARAKTRQRG